MNTKYPILLILLILLSLPVHSQIYVSTKGDDSNPGTKHQPLATLTAARDAIRKLKADNSNTSPLTVTVEDGVYEMSEPLFLTREDGGIKYMAAKGAKPVFSGGRKITGFKIGNDGIWQVKIPDCVSSDFRFDQLYVNGKRAVLARTPNVGFLKIKEIKEIVQVKGTGRVPEKAQQILSFTKEDFNSLKGIPKEEQDLLRFRAYHKWDFTLRYLDSLSSEKLSVYTTGQGMKPWNSIKKGGRIVFENYRAALDTPGEWFLNNKGVLFYYPKAGETPENTEVIIPVLEKLISIKGNPLKEEYVENIAFEGLRFSYCNYRIPKTGFEPNQAAVSVSAAVHVVGARGISFENCEITQTGQHALWLAKGCSNCTVSHCNLTGLGGGGIYLGISNPVNDYDHTSHITIDNNIIHSGGREFPPAVGVWVGHSSDNKISHNDIADFYYTGISVGWIWGYAPSKAKRNIITYNNIHHIGWTLLSDMAAVYTLGKSEGTKINNNVIHHVHAYSYGGWGLYPDEGTSDIEMKNNLVYSTKTGGFHQHYGANNTIENNILAYAKLYQVQCTRVEDHLSFSFEKNIVLFDEGVVLNGSWNKIRIKMDNNIYWNTKGDKYDFSGKSFKKWKKTGHDEHSIIADPGFKNPAKYNFKLKNRSTIDKIGFVPFDYSKAGVYGSKRWKKQAELAEEILLEFDKEVNENLTKDTGRN